MNEDHGSDLTGLARELRTCFRYDPPRGYRAGKKRVGEMVRRFCHCSSERASAIVNRLERHGYMVASVRSSGSRWRFEPHPLDSV